MKRKKKEKDLKPRGKGDDFLEEMLKEAEEDSIMTNQKGQRSFKRRKA